VTINNSYRVGNSSPLYAGFFAPAFFAGVFVYFGIGFQNGRSNIKFSFPKGTGGKSTHATTQT
jgi:hypothetical protein